MVQKTIQKVTRKRLSLEEQSEVAQHFTTEDAAAQTMAAFGISKQNLLNIKKNTEDIIQQAKETSRSLETKAACVPHFSVIEKNLYKFFQKCRAHKMPITMRTIRHRARMLQDKIVEEGKIENEEAQEMEMFTTSKGWEINFAKRQALRSVTLFGEAASANIAAGAHDMNTLRTNLSNYSLDCTFNLDKTGLFYKLLSRKNYVCSHENCFSVRGTKAM